MKKNKFGNFHVVVFQTNESFNKFQGKEIKTFVNMCVEISQLINAELDMSDPVVASMQQALLLWSRIEPFLKRIYIEPDEHEQYEHEIESFKNNVILFITCGAKTFLTKHKTGDDETFYMHA